MSHALVIIDVQNDFCPGGALAVPEGNLIVPGINDFMAQHDLVVLSQDWHPKNHSSFASNHEGRNPMDRIDTPYGDQVLWPDHCIQGSFGGEFHKDLNTDAANMIIRKGTNPDLDSYSVFAENDKATPTGLSGYLRVKGITDISFAGLATDFCVAWSALDAVHLGFNATVHMDISRAIDVDDSLEISLGVMRDAGVNIV